MTLTSVRPLVSPVGVMVFAATLGLGTAGAAPISFQLLDHPDGNLTASHGPYGLRYDANPPAGPGPTYSVSTNGANAILTIFDDNTARISGTVWNNASSALFNVVYDMTLPTLHSGGWSWDAGTGTLADGPTGLTGKRGGPGNHAFNFLPDDHRLAGHGFSPGTFVGRGWLQAPGTNDWLVVGERIVTSTTDVVAEPTSLALLGLGLVGLAARQRRR